MIDTAQKRMSAVNIGSPWRGPMVVASGTEFDQDNRQALAFIYSGILAQIIAPPPPPPPPPPIPPRTRNRQGATVTWLPHFAEDGDEIIDRYGSKWRFSGATGTWIWIGSVPTHTEVTEENDGLVPPTIYSKIEKAKELLADRSTSPFKILPGIDGYWYYFRSSDKLYKFRPEGTDTLRLEIDRGRLYQIIYKTTCRGSKGDQGEQGEKGDAGAPGPSELCYQPTIQHNKLSFSVITPFDGRLDSPISIRLYETTGDITQNNQITAWNQLLSNEHPFLKSIVAIQDSITNSNLSGEPCGLELSDTISSAVIENSHQAEINYDPTTNSIQTISSSIDITPKSISYDYKLQILCGSIILNNGVWSDNWCVKVRQRGPQGDTGDDGDPKLVIDNCELNTTNIIPTCPLVSVRLDCDRNILLTSCADVFSEVCTSRLAFLANSDTIAASEVTSSSFAAVQRTIDDCKRIFRYDLSLATADISDPTLAHWEPQPGCTINRNFDRHKFDWAGKTTTNGCRWFNHTDTIGDKYPYDIIIPVKQPTQCCQDDFFYCNNIQTAPITETSIA